MARFTIRDLLWATVVAAMTIGWWIDRSRLQDQLAKLKTDVQMQRAFNFDHRIENGLR